MANHDVYTISKTGVTSSAPKVIYNIDVNAMIRIFPTVAGTASLYSSGSMQSLIEADIVIGNTAIINSTNAKWTKWTADDASIETVQTAALRQKAIALVVSSGTWTLEVAQ